MSPLEQLAVVCGWHSGTGVIVLWTYLDESGEHSGARNHLKRLSLGGFTAPWANIKRLCERWRDALNAESLVDFHMNDIFSDEAGFDSWEPARQKRLSRFVDVLCDEAVVFNAYSYGGDRPKGLFREAYNHGIARALIDLENFCVEIGERGHVVFAKTDEIRHGHVGSYFDRIDWDECLDGFTIQKSRENPALQAAEIVARGMKRVMQDGFVTYSFRRILDAGKPTMFWPSDPFGATAQLGHAAH